MIPPHRNHLTSSFIIMEVHLQINIPLDRIIGDIITPVQDLIPIHALLKI